MLFEGRASRFTQIFQGLPPVPQVDIPRKIAWAISVLKRQDRIVWYLRWVRVNIEKMLLQTNGNNQELVAQLTRRLSQFGQKNEPPLSFHDVLRTPSLRDTEVEHIMSMMHIPQLERLVWEWQTPVELSQQCYAIEEKWKAERGQWIDMDSDHEAELIMKFPDGFAWWNLNRSYCQIEGNAMGHCGNAAARDGTVLSLRHAEKRGDKVWWRPVATFILHDDGSLGEMKGRANKKPNAEYHPYIVALLRNNIISSIDGGGYAPEENFSMNDLDPKEREQLYKEKPSLKSGNLAQLWKESGEDINNQEVLAALAKQLARHDLSEFSQVSQSRGIDASYKIELEEVDNVDKPVIVLNNLGDSEKVLREYGDAIPWAKELQKMIDDNDLDRDITSLDTMDWREIIEEIRPETREFLFRLTGTQNDARLATAMAHPKSHEVARLLNQVEVSKLDVGAIKERIDRYIGIGLEPIFSLGSYQHSAYLGRQGEDWVYWMAPDSYINFMIDMIDAKKNAEDQNYEGGGDDDWTILDFIQKQDDWIYIDDNDDHHFQLERLKDEGLIEGEGYNQDDYIDTEYGVGGTEFNHSYAHMLDQYVAKSSTRVNDPRQASLNLEEIAYLRRMAGIRG